MTREEAERIIFLKMRMDEVDCSCHCGNPPCSKCVDSPSDKEVSEAEKILEKN